MLTIIQGDAVERLRELPDESVQCCVTSPPYWGLRDYGTAAWGGGDDGCDHKIPAYLLGGGSNKSHNGSFTANYRDECKCGARRIDSQLGLEKTPELFVQKMVEVFREVRRVLRKDGTLWLNLGDSYNGVGRGEKANGLQVAARATTQRTVRGLKEKDLCGIPWRVAFALQADGWWLRSDIIWAKPNPMPESVTDRPTKSHEYLFLLTKASTYYYDAEAIKERAITVEDRPFGVIRDREWGYDSKEAVLRGRKVHPETSGSNGTSWKGHSGNTKADGTPICGDSRNKRSVWTVATAPYPEAHFATYPPDLIKPCIMAGTSAKGCCAKCGAPWERITEKGDVLSLGGSSDDNRLKARIADSGPMERRNADGSSASQFSHQFVHRENKTLGWQPTCKCEKRATVGGEETNQAAVSQCTVLDPFAGSGTTGAVALELGRKAVLIELNPKYVELIEERCNVTMGLALAC